MIKNLLLLLVIIFAINNAHAQESDSTDSMKVKYGDFLKYDCLSHTYFVFGGYHYLNVPKSANFKTGGTILNVGFNVARFFSKKIIVGVTADWKYFFGYTNQSFSNEFVTDFNSSFIDEQNSLTDSLRANILKDAINGVSGHGFNGNQFGNIGIAFSLFPRKYGGIMLQIKKGWISYPINGDEGKEELGKENDQNLPTFSLKNNIFVDLTFKPYRFFNSERVNVEIFKWKDLFKKIAITLYYERISLEKSDYDGLRLENIVGDDFVSKYGAQQNFGIKIGLALY
jgi:hypothetical protein